MTEPENLKEGDIVLICGDCEATRRSYGFDDRMKQYIGTIQVVDRNPCGCGCIRLKGTDSFTWHRNDLKKNIKQPDIKKKIKPVLFNEEQIIQGE